MTIYDLRSTIPFSIWTIFHRVDRLCSDDLVPRGKGADAVSLKGFNRFQARGGCGWTKYGAATTWTLFRNAPPLMNAFRKCPYHTEAQIVDGATNGPPMGAVNGIILTDRQVFRENLEGRGSVSGSPLYHDG